MTLNYVDAPSTWKSYKIESTIAEGTTTSSKKAKKKNRSKKSRKMFHQMFVKKQLVNKDHLYES